MAVQIRRWTGAGPTKTDITSINTRLNAEDTHTTAGTSNPILVPAAGTNYSYWANTRLYFNGSGTGTINNIKWYSDGGNTLGTGVGLVAATAGVYGEASGTPGTSGTELSVANYGNGTTDLNEEPVNAFTLTAGSPKSVTGSVTNPNNSELSHFVVLQITVGSTAAAGATTQETMTWQYDSTVA